MALLATLGVIGLGIAKLLGLEGVWALVPSSVLVGGIVAFVVVANVADTVRRRRRPDE